MQAARVPRPLPPRISAVHIEKTQTSPLTEQGSGTVGLRIPRRPRDKEATAQSDAMKDFASGSGALEPFVPAASPSCLGAFGDAGELFVCPWVVCVVCTLEGVSHTSSS